MDIDLLPDEIESLKKHNLIPTIKSVRERTGLGLPEAKDAVEQAAMRLGLFEERTCHSCHGTGRVRAWKR